MQRNLFFTINFCKRAFIAGILIIIFGSAAFAAKRSTSLNSKPCSALLTWMKRATWASTQPSTWANSVSPKTKSAEELRQELDITRQKIAKRMRAQGTSGRRFEAENYHIFENLLWMLATKEDSNFIASQLEPYVTPMVIQAVRVAEWAKVIHEILISQKMNPDARPNALNLYVQNYITDSERLGRLHYRYDLVMQTLDSVGKNKGLSHVPEELVHHESNPKKLNGITVAYVLKSARVAKLAREVSRELIDRAIRQSGEFGKTELQTKGIYPSLQMVEKVYNNDLYAVLANAKQGLRQQNYTDRPLVWITQFASDWVVNNIAMNGTAKFIPPGFRRFVRFITGVGNNHSMLSRYLPDLLRFIRVTRFVNGKGDLVISTHDYFVDLQVKKLFDSSAASFNDEELVTLLRLDWFSDVTKNIVAYAAKNPIYLERIEKAKQRAQKLGPINFVSPQTRAVAVRFALMSIGWSTIFYKAGAQVYANWPLIQNHFIHLISPLLQFFVK